MPKSFATDRASAFAEFEDCNVPFTRWHCGRKALVEVGECARLGVRRSFLAGCDNRVITIAKSCAVSSSYSQGNKHDAPDEIDRRFTTFLSLPFVLDHSLRQIIR